MRLSIVIPSYRREQVLLDTVHALLEICSSEDEVIVIDQTQVHVESVEKQLREWDKSGSIRWLLQGQPSVVAAMNRGLRVAHSDLVLFLDDDIVPSPDLLAVHRRAHQEQPELWAVTGQILQPGQGLDSSCSSSQSHGLRADLDFAFNSTRPCEIKNVMAGNLSVKKQHAVAIGGFDENFLSPISFRFETDFARRICMAGGKIRFEPAASIQHLAFPTGGTRSLGSHLRSASPLHGVGDYYFALVHGRGAEGFLYILCRPFREVRTRYHLRHPWWIPVKFVGEIRAMFMAFRLDRHHPEFYSMHSD